MIDEEQDIFLLDVREPFEFDAWHIGDAVNIPLGQLRERLGEIPTGKKVVSICARGARAQEAADLLSLEGLDVEVLEGGMARWGHTYEIVSVTHGAVTVTQIRRRGKGCLSYVIGASGRGIVIDPSIDTSVYQDIATRQELTITHVLDTHLHADHVSGARQLASDVGAVLMLNGADSFSFPYEAMVGGDVLALSNDTRLEVLGAPGHTEGSTAFLLSPQFLFTGDTLFLESVGRPDLADQAEPFARELHRTLHDIVLALDDDVRVLPAHYGSAVTVVPGELVTRRLGELRATLPALSLNEEDFVAWALANVRDRPDNYREIVLFNAGASTKSRDEIGELELGPNRCAIAS